MKRRFWFLYTIITCLLLFPYNALSQPSISTIDGNMGAEWAGYSANENWVGSGGYVGPGTGGQNFDVERIGIYVDDTHMYIGLQTGFELNYRESVNNTNYYPGNIAVGFTSPGTTTDYQELTPSSYQFAFEFDFGSFQGEDDFDPGHDYLSDANLIIHKVDTWSTVDHGGDTVGPFPYRASGSSEEMGHVEGMTTSEGVVIAGLDGQVAYQRYDQNGNPYGDDTFNDAPYFNTIEAAIKLSDLKDKLTEFGEFDFSGGFNANIFWTMACNNDMLGKSYTYHIPGGGSSPIPEPGTFLLFGIGLLGASSFGRKKMKLS